MKAPAAPAAGKTGERTAECRCPGLPESSARPAQKCREVVAYVPHIWYVNAISYHTCANFACQAMAEISQLILIHCSLVSHLRERLINNRTLRSRRWAGGLEGSRPS